ncbi:MAG: MFS transporter [Symploca sp. SIO3C6]|nr:MFS transporter [Symploca sp. SIO3C6]
MISRSELVGSSFPPLRLKSTAKNLLHPDYPFQPSRFPFFYGWIILAVCTVGMIMSLPGHTMGLSIFTDHLLLASGLSRLELSNAYLVGTLASGLLLPIGGVLLDRFGARALVIGSSIWLAVTLCYLSFSDQLATLLDNQLPIELYSTIVLVILVLGFISLGFSGQGMLTMISLITLGKWFERRRGFTSSIAGILMSFGFAIIPLMLSSWMNIWGWRHTLVIMAVFIGIGMGVVGWIFYRDNPEECGLSMDGAAETSSVNLEPTVESDLQDFTRDQALRTSMFWVVTLALSCQTLVVTAITFHIVDIGAEAGLSEIQVLALFLPMTIISTIIGYLVGMAADRFPLKYMFILMILFQAVSVVCSGNMDSLWFRWLTVVGLGTSGGCFSTLSAVALPHFFGRAYLGAISGVQMMVTICLSAIGPSLLAMFKGQFGSYQSGLYVCCIFPAVVLILAILARNPQEQAN